MFIVVERQRFLLHESTHAALTQDPPAAQRERGESREIAKASRFPEAVQTGSSAVRQFYGGTLIFVLRRQKETVVVFSVVNCEL